MKGYPDPQVYVVRVERGGRRPVTFARVTSRRAARRLVARLARLGIAADVETVEASR